MKKHFVITLVGLIGSASFACADKAAPSAPAVPGGSTAPSAPTARVAPTAPPAPASEIKAIAKELGGTWSCSGQALIDGKLVEAKGTLTNKLDGDALAMSFVATSGKSSYKQTSRTTFTDTDNFVRVLGDGEKTTADSINEGMAGKWGIVFVGGSHSTETISVSRDGVHLTGVVDQGTQTEKTVYDATCKRPKVAKRRS